MVKIPLIFLLLTINASFAMKQVQPAKASFGKLCPEAAGAVFVMKKNLHELPPEMRAAVLERYLMNGSIDYKVRLEVALSFLDDPESYHAKVIASILPAPIAINVLEFAAMRGYMLDRSLIQVFQLDRRKTLLKDLFLSQESLGRINDLFARVTMEQVVDMMDRKVDRASFFRDAFIQIFPGDDMIDYNVQIKMLSILATIQPESCDIKKICQCWSDHIHAFRLINFCRDIAGNSTDILSPGFKEMFNRIASKLSRWMMYTVKYEIIYIAVGIEDVYNECVRNQNSRYSREFDPRITLESYFSPLHVLD